MWKIIFFLTFQALHDILSQIDLISCKEIFIRDLISSINQEVKLNFKKQFFRVSLLKKSITDSGKKLLKLKKKIY
jgi:hypothetical protein